MSDQARVYGLMAELASAEALRDAALALRSSGYERLEAFSPYPIHGLASDLGQRHDWIAFWTLMGGIAGAAISFFLQYYAAVIDYPINIGGRPLNSWPAFIPMSVEFAIVGAASWATLSLLISNRLPQLYHPVFNVERFEHASRDGFFLCVRSDDERYDASALSRRLTELGARHVTEVPW